MKITDSLHRNRCLRLAGRLGVAGFLFFLRKGLLWLLMALFIAFWRSLGP